MKSSLVSVLVVLASSTCTYAWGPGFFGGGWTNWPSCASSCMGTFTGSSCAGDATCVCKDSTLISNANSCVASSSCSDTDKSSVYQNIAQLCANVGAPVTASPEATFSATSNSAWSGGPWSGGWASSGGGYGPFGGNWGPFASSGAWTAGPWSRWWDGSACPGETWTGWTSGDWSKDAPWTSWTGCTATTTASTTFTTTSSGSIITGTSFGIKVAEQTGTTSGAISTSTRAGSAASSVARMGIGFVVVTLVVIIQG